MSNSLRPIIDLVTEFLDKEKLDVILRRSETTQLKLLTDSTFLPKMVEDVIEGLSNRGQLKAFVRVFVAEYKDNPRARALLLLVENSPSPSAISEEAHAPTPDPDDQSITAPRNPIRNALEEDLTDAIIRRRICQIRHDHDPFGTGFLIGPDLVMTSYHVVRHHLYSDRWQTFFDYDTDPIDLTKAIDFGPEPWACHSAELDYVVIRLAHPVDPRRRWFPLDPRSSTLAEGDPITIYQHNGGRPLGIARGAFRHDPNPDRVLYTTNTEKGSSGAAVFDRHLRLVALHRRNDDLTRNEAVHIGPITRDIQAKHPNLLVDP